MKQRSPSRLSSRPITIAITAIMSALIGIGGFFAYQEYTKPPSNGTVKGATSNRYLSPIFSDYTLQKDILYGNAPQYKSTKNQPLYLDLYQPSGDTSTRRPAIIWIHGGGFSSGTKNVYNVGGHELGPIYAKHGYVSIAIDYRLADHTVKPNDPTGYAIVTMAKHDALAAVRWVRAHATEYRINPNAIIVAGHSSGAVIALYAAYDTANVGTSGTPDVSSNVQAAVSISGAMHPDHISTIQTGDPSSIMLHGENDKTVPYAFAQAVDTRLTNQQIPHTFYHYANVSHDMIGATNVHTSILTFLYETLSLDESETINPAHETSRANFDGMGGITIVDFTLFMQYWWTNNIEKGDLNYDGKLSVIDYTLFMNEWYTSLHR